jgi:hypothetical protein
MANAGLTFEDRLEGASNFSPWRERIGFLLEEQGLWEFVEGIAILPADPTQQPAHLKRDVKARRIIIDGVKDHIIPHLSRKKTTKDMWEALVKLYQSDNQSRKMLLREKLRSTKMARGESVVTYLTKFTHIIDELAVVGEIVDETELVRTALNGFTKQWDVFVKGVVAQEKLPNWERLWDDFTREELRVGTSQASQPKSEDEENLALAGKEKFRGKKGPSGGQTSKRQKKKDFSKIKYFYYHKPSHFASQCPNKGSKKSHIAASASTEVEEFATRFENEFSSIACLSSSTSSIAWYVDSGASSHMTRVQEYFYSLQEEEMDLLIEMGNNAKCRAACLGAVTFQRESGKPLMVKDVLYVPCMKKNMISVSGLEGRGYVVSFQDGRVYIRPKDSKVAKVIGVRYEKLYRLKFEPTQALVSSRCDLAELWHRNMAHLHNGALKVLKVLKEIVTGLPDFSTEHHEVCKGCVMVKYT